MKSVPHLNETAPLPVVPPRPDADDTAGTIPHVDDIMEHVRKNMKPEEFAELLVRQRSHRDARGRRRAVASTQGVVPKGTTDHGRQATIALNQMDQPQQPDPPQPHVVDAALVLQRLQILAGSIDNCLAPLRSLLAELETGTTCSEQSAMASRLLQQCRDDENAVVEIGALVQSGLSEVEQAKVAGNAQPKVAGQVEQLPPADDQPTDDDKITHVVKEVSAAHGRGLDRMEHIKERLKGLKALKESGAVMVPVVLVIDALELIQTATCRDVIAIDAALTAIGR